MCQKYAELIQSALCRVNTKGVSRPKPSLFFYPGLISKSIHKFTPSTSSSSDLSLSLLKVANALNQNYSAILDEYKRMRESQSNLNDYKMLTDEHRLHQGGSWEWNSYILKGKRQTEFAVSCPRTVEIFESFYAPKLMSEVPFSYAFFSTLGKNTNITAHYGPCNLRLRCHFPLKVPAGDCGMLIANEKIKWTPGEAIFFDDTYEHSGM